MSFFDENNIQDRIKNKKTASVEANQIEKLANEKKEETISYVKDALLEFASVAEKTGVSQIKIKVGLKTVMVWAIHPFSTLYIDSKSKYYIEKTSKKIVNVDIDYASKVCGDQLFNQWYSEYTDYNAEYDGNKKGFLERFDFKKHVKEFFENYLL